MKYRVKVEHFDRHINKYSQITALVCLSSKTRNIRKFTDKSLPNLARITDRLGLSVVRQYLPAKTPYLYKCLNP